MCQQRMPMEVSETPDIPLEVEAARETERIEREVEKLAAEIKHDCRIYTEIWSDIRKSQTAEQKARWKEVQAFLRRGIRLNLSMLEWYEEVHSFDFPDEYRYFFNINPPPTEGGENWLVETKENYMIRTTRIRYEAAAQSQPSTSRRRIRVVIDYSSDHATPGRRRNRRR